MCTDAVERGRFGPKFSGSMDGQVRIGNCVSKPSVFHRPFVGVGVCSVAHRPSSTTFPIKIFQY
jgi:hypothetical protein